MKPDATKLRELHDVLVDVKVRLETLGTPAGIIIHLEFAIQRLEEFITMFETWNDERGPSK